MQNVCHLRNDIIVPTIRTSESSNKNITIKRQKAIFEININEKNSAKKILKSLLKKGTQ